MSERREAEQPIPARAPAPKQPPVRRERPAGGWDLADLQRRAGNRAVQRLLSGGSSLYAPKTWMDTQFDDRDDTVRDVVGAGGSRPLQTQLFDNIRNATGIAIDTVTEVDPLTNLTRILVGDGFKPEGPTQRQQYDDRKAWRKPMARMLPDLNRILVLPADSVFRAEDAAAAPVRLTIHPKELVRAESDLGTVMNMEYACSLIAIVKSVEGAYGALNPTLGLTRSLTSDADYYPRMHQHYFVDRHIDYDEPSTHPQVFAEWGFSMIFSGDVGFLNLPRFLPKPLSTGKKYIFEIPGHTVYVKVKKAVPVGRAFKSETEILSFLEFRSDKGNFNHPEYKRNVNYIYEK